MLKNGSVAYVGTEFEYSYIGESAGTKHRTTNVRSWGVMEVTVTSVAYVASGDVAVGYFVEWKPDSFRRPVQGPYPTSYVDADSVFESRAAAREHVIRQIGRRINQTHAQLADLNNRLLLDQTALQSLLESKREG